MMKISIFIYILNMKIYTYARHDLIFQREAVDMNMGTCNDFFVRKNYTNTHMRKENGVGLYVYIYIYMLHRHESGLN